MIRVNLLPQDLGAKGKSRTASGGAGQGSAAITFLTLLIFIGSIGGAGWGFWYTLEQVNQRAREEKKLKDEVTKLKNDEATLLAQFEELKERERQALTRGRVLLSLDPPDRILWAEKLNMLADLRPEGIAITKIELIEDVKMVTSPESIKEIAAWEAAQREAKNKKATDGAGSDGVKKKRGGSSTSTKPKEIKIPVVNQTLRIEGIAYRLNQRDRLADVNDFRGAMEHHFATLENNQIRRFMHGFQESIERGNIVDIDNYQGSNRLVSSFSYSIKGIPAGDVDADTLLKRLSEDLERRRRAAEARSALLSSAPAPTTTAPTPAPGN